MEWPQSTWEVEQSPNGSAEHSLGPIGVEYKDFVDFGLIVLGILLDDG